MFEMPPYKRVYEALRKDISQGVFAPGSLLPSEFALCERFDVARPTLRKALDQLAAEDLIVKHQGKGSMVKGMPKGIGILSVSGTTSALGGHIRTRVLLGPERREWTEAFSFPITEEERQGGCIYFERLRYTSQMPLFLDITMMPLRPFLEDFREWELEDASLFEMLRLHYRLNVIGGTQQLFALKADHKVQEYLQVKSGSAVLQLNRKIETSMEDYFFYSRIFCATHGFGLTGTF